MMALNRMLGKMIITSLVLTGSVMSYGLPRDPTQPQAAVNESFHGYTLTAIMMPTGYQPRDNKHPASKIAVINDKIVHIGDQIDNATVTAINDNTVELDAPTGKIVLTLMISPLIPMVKGKTD